jgi:hypothetical protein
MIQHTIYSTLTGVIRATITGDMETLMLNLHESEDYVVGDWPGHLYKVDLTTGEVVEIPQA